MAEIDVDMLVDANPAVDRRELEKSRELLKQLRAAGVRAHGYTLAPLAAGHRLSIRSVSCRTTEHGAKT